MKNALVKLALIGLFTLSLTSCLPGDKLPADAKEIYVKADTGSDSNSGAFEKPLKTIKKALEVATSGQTIILFEGTYNAASGQSFGYTVRGGVNIKANSGRVLIEGSATSTGFYLAGAVSMKSLTLKGFSTAISSSTDASITFSDMKFEAATVGSFTAISYDGGSGSLEITDTEFNGKFGSAVFIRGKAGGTRPKLTMQNTQSINGGQLLATNTANVVLNQITAKGDGSSFGVYMYAETTLQITGSNFSNFNGTLALRGVNNQLKLRDSRFDDVRFVVTADYDFTEIDLGTTGNPGQNTFTNIKNHALSISNNFLTRTRTIEAVGNIWVPNVQGSNANGQYASQLVCNDDATYTAGGNYEINGSFDRPKLCVRL
jgi:hypothetical protein